MNPEAMSEALDAIYEEAEKLLKLDLPLDVQKRLELILSISRYKFDVRSDEEKEGNSPPNSI